MGQPHEREMCVMRRLVRVGMEQRNQCLEDSGLAMKNECVNWIQPIEVATSTEEGSEGLDWKTAMLVHPCQDDYGSNGQGGMLVVTEEGYSVHFDRYQEQLVDHDGWMIRNRPRQKPNRIESFAEDLIPSSDEIENRISLLLREYYWLKRLEKLARTRYLIKRDRENAF